MKKIMVILFSGVVFPVMSAASQNMPGEHDEYADKVRTAVMQKFYNAYEYEGKQCDLRIIVNYRGERLATDISGNQNDDALCEEAKIVISRVTLPSFETENKSEKKRIVLRFRP